MTDDRGPNAEKSADADGIQVQESAEIPMDKMAIPDSDTNDYLESFNIDTGTSADGSDIPHYIINLNVYNSDCFSASEDSGLESMATVPVNEPQPSTSDPHCDPSNKASSSASPIPVMMHPFLRPSSRGRARGRCPSVFLDDVMEQKIRTFEGRDGIQQLDQLQRQFPRFKRAYINRVFTRNMLNYEKTFAQLNEETKKEMEKFANVRLIQAPKQMKPETKTPCKPDFAALNPQSMMYLGVPLGHCPPHIANTLYRRVIVNPDGTVESADERERRYLDSHGLTAAASTVFHPLLRPSIKPEANPPFPLFPTSSPNHGPFPPGPNMEDLPDTDTSATPPQSTNRFFRSNRGRTSETKKRDYVDRELRNAKAAVAAATRRSRGNGQGKNVVDTEAASEEKNGDAVKYMASVGVVSTPIQRKRSTKRDDKLQENSQTESATDKVAEKNHIPPLDVPPNDGLSLTNEERKNILSFFNDALLDELALMPGCSKKTAQIIDSLRPFTSTAHLLARLSETRFLSPNLIDSCKEILQMRSTVIRLLQRCERLTERVSSHAAKLFTSTISLPDSAADSSEYPSKMESVENSSSGLNHLLTQQPAILNPLRELKPYQLVGLNWLRLLHQEQVNGILGDEMGLGKTIQAIAFLASLWEGGDRGPHLIICPSSTQENWQRELADWCSHLKVLVYQGSAEQRKAIRLKIYEAGGQPDFNILLTSYAIGTSTIEDRALMKRVNFHYGIFDEAHMLKNMTSQRYRHLTNFRVQRRLLLTGTPLQNNLLELISLLSFVMPDMFMRSTDLLKRMFQIYSKPASEKSEKQRTEEGELSRSHFQLERLAQAKYLLQPFFLRRLKSQVLNQLPPKTCEVVRVPMTPSQAQQYWALVDQFRQIADSRHAEKPSESEAALVTAEPEGDENKEPTKDEIPVKKLCLESTDETSSVNGIEVKGQKNSIKPSASTDSLSSMVTMLRKAANHTLLLSGIAYSEAGLRDIAETLHLDPSHVNSDPQLIFEDLSVLSDHQIHKVCQFYDVLSSFTLPVESIMLGSGKIAWLDTNIPKFLAEGHRLLIFSQFVIVLDILEEFLRSKDRRYLRLDGNTPVNERQEMIDRFNSSSIEVFLLSTRAGGLGINLTGADMVIIHDIDYNPYNDRQAEDRAHRLGQTRPVHVIRLISEGTVEEGILRTAAEKLELEQNVTGQTDSQGLPCAYAGADYTPANEEFAEQDDVELKVLGSPKTNFAGSAKVPAIPSRRGRMADHDLWLLITDAIKSRPH
ncbi:unnamed protein product [Calicophoron daubneyi]|uniref:DNA helicase n=1 Tax=Calicophoron daubneyi TaxID=300641 RepID=A0AAV2THN6_CALDB